MSERVIFIHEEVISELRRDFNGPSSDPSGIVLNLRAPRHERDHSISSEPFQAWESIFMSQRTHFMFDDLSLDWPERDQSRSEQPISSLRSPPD